MLLAGINAINSLRLAKLRLLFSKVVVPGERTRRAARGSWLFCDDDPGNDTGSMSRLLFVHISSIKT